MIFCFPILNGFDFTFVLVFSHCSREEKQNIEAWVTDSNDKFYTYMVWIMTTLWLSLTYMAFLWKSLKTNYKTIYVSIYAYFYM